MSSAHEALQFERHNQSGSKEAKQSKAKQTYQNLFIIKDPTLPSQEQNGSSHIRIVTLASSGIGRFHVHFRLVDMIAVTACHFRGKDAWRDDVDSHVDALKGGCEHAGKVC